MESVPTSGHTAGRTVPLARDLQVLGRLAAQRRLPILLAFVSGDCEYCRQVEEDFLEPMRISGDYENRVLMRRVRIDGEGLLRDFEGRTVTPQELADRYHVQMVPTLLFLDPKGREIAERLVGLTTPDFYGGYLDAAIEQALRQLRQDSP